MNKPMYKHDCPNCRYVTAYQNFDVYYCKSEFNDPKIVTRWNDGVEDYKTISVGVFLTLYVRGEIPIDVQEKAMIFGLMMLGHIFINSQDVKTA